jgi:type IV secretory pathway VirB10-like protein
MDFILDNIFIIVLLFVGAISQWLKARGGSRPDNGGGYDPAEREEMIEQAERRQARPAVPPPLARAAAPPPLPGSERSRVPELSRRSRMVTPAFDNSRELERQQALAAKLKEMKQSKAAKKAEDMMFPDNKTTRSAPDFDGLGLKARLRDRTELRRAFVLREILEKPISLR